MLRYCLTFATVALSLVTTSLAQTLPLPWRTTNSISASEFVRQIKFLPAQEREDLIASEILKGNIPSTLREFYPLTITNISGEKTDVATIFVARDYLSVGTDEEHFYSPLTPATAQRIADALDCSLPTRKMVNTIYATAEIKLAPQPIPPSRAMTTVPVFAAHNEIIRTQLVALGKFPSSNALLAGHKKDVVISAKLGLLTNKVAIYGWHRTNGTPIQPLYTGHSADWADYSHGIRLVAQHMILNGQHTTVASVLANAQHAELLSDEGAFTQSRYPTNIIATTNKPSRASTNSFGERISTLTLAPKVKVEINSPSATEFASDKPVLLVLFALPNGNSIAQTVGKKLSPGDDWHYNIQHIGAQTRFLRAVLTNRTVVIAYLEAEMKSWPEWRKKFGDAVIPDIVAAVKQQFPISRLELVLTGHSGGGSFTFGYLNALDTIPADVKRIAFLDSNYAYETTNHFDKFNSWLKSSDENALCVLAYHDSIALLNGKTFVSERGGTWGRSHSMLEDFEKQFALASRTNTAGLETHIALNGRVQFLLKQNPEKKILHTIQVERNGFIHAMLTSTHLENIGYEYLGDRAYSQWIQAE